MMTKLSHTLLPAVIITTSVQASENHFKPLQTAESLNQPEAEGNTDLHEAAADIITGKSTTGYLLKNAS